MYGLWVISREDLVSLQRIRVSLEGSKHRPDLQIKSKFGYIINEIDEHQHKDYPEELEEKRMRKIYNDVQIIAPNSEVMFIRYNPDNYQGIQMDKEAKQKYLFNTITWLKECSKINLPLSKITLFYDGFDGNPKIEPIHV